MLTLLFIRQYTRWLTILCGIFSLVCVLPAQESIFNKKDAHILQTPKMQKDTLPFANGEGTLGMPEKKIDEPSVEKLTEESLVKILKEYVGGWTGKMTIRTMSGDKINTFDVEQQYWWNDAENKLESLAVFDDAGILRYAQSVNFIKDGFIYCDVKEGVETKQYKAKIEDEGIVWLPLDKQRALDHQLRQKVYSKSDGLYMLNSGFERFKRGKIDVMLLLEGDLKKNVETEKTDTPPQTVK